MKNCDRNQQRGVFTVVVAIAIPVILATFGLGLDISRYVWVGTQLQNAADAAAFAGSRELNGTTNGRMSATNVATLYAQQNSVDGQSLSAAEVVENVTGRWDFSSGTFTSTGVSDPGANALRVTVQRQDVPTMFARVFAAELSSRTFAKSAVAVAGGPGGAGCTAPFVLASCVIQHDSSGEMICPATLSFQNGAQSAGLTLPDGTSPVNGNRAAPYIQDVMADPTGCAYATAVGDTLYLQNGNDLSKGSVNDINAATNDGANPISIVMAVVDKTCGGGSPTYNQSAEITGYIKMNIVGARGTKAAPAQVEAACPGIGKKNICVSPNCSPIAGAPAGGTAQVVAGGTHLVQ